MKTVNAKNLKATLNSIKKSDAAMADNIQATIEYGFEVLTSDLERPNFDVFTRLIEALGDLRNKNVKAVSSYLDKQVKGMVWDKDSKTYKKAKSKNVKVEVERVNYPYWQDAEMHKQGQHIQTVKVNQRIEKLIQQLYDTSGAVNVEVNVNDLRQQAQALLAFADTFAEA